MNKHLILAVFSFLFIMGFSTQAKADDIFGNKILNGDFEQFDGVSMAAFGNSTINGYSWSPVGGGDDCTTVNDHGNNLCAIFSGNCTYRNMTGHCLGMTPETNGREFQSNAFTWTSNSTSAAVVLYFKTNETTASINLTFGLYDTSGVTPLLSGGNTVPTFFCYDVNSNTKVIRCSMNMTYAALFSAPTVFTNSPLQNGKTYRLFFHSGIGQNFWLDNVSVTDPTFNQNIRILSSKCTIDQPNNTNSFGSVLGCKLPDINIQSCVNITSVTSEMLLNWWNKNACGGTGKGTETSYFAFNTTNTQKQTTSQCFLPVIAPDQMFTTGYDFLTPAQIIGQVFGLNLGSFNDSSKLSTYQNQDFIKASCYYSNLNSNFTLKYAGCILYVGCIVETTTDCNRQCYQQRDFWGASNANLYVGGTFDPTTSQCMNFTSSSPCGNGFCASSTECDITNSVNVTNSTDTTPFNITGNVYSTRLYTKLFSISGATMLIIFVIAAFMYAAITEMMAVYWVSIAFLITTAVGLFPVSLGIPVSLGTFLINRLVEDED